MRELIFTMRKLKNIVRCSTYRRVHDENVAEHSYYVSILSMMIADELLANEKFPWRSCVDIGLVSRKALLHDADEALTGDIIFPVKHHNDEIRSAVKKTAEIMWNLFFDNLPDRVKHYRDLASTAKDGVCGKIVGIADMLELCIYCYEEISLGNINMKEILYRGLSIIRRHPYYDYLPSIAEFVSFLERLEFSELVKVDKMMDEVADAYNHKEIV